MPYSPPTPRTEEQPYRYEQFHEELHEIFDVEQHPTVSTNDVEWTERHDLLLEKFAKARFNSNPYLAHNYVDLFELYAETVENGTLADGLDDPHLKSFGLTLLTEPELAEDFLTRYQETFLVQTAPNSGSYL